MNYFQTIPLRRLLWPLVALACGVALLWIAHAISLSWGGRADVARAAAGSNSSPDKDKEESATPPRKLLPQRPAPRSQEKAPTAVDVFANLRGWLPVINDGVQAVLAPGSPLWQVAAEKNTGEVAFEGKWPALGSPDNHQARGTPLPAAAVAGPASRPTPSLPSATPVAPSPPVTSAPLAPPPAGPPGKSCDAPLLFTAAAGPSGESGSADSQERAGSSRPPHYRSGSRSQSMEMSAQEADRHSHRGFELAGVGAYFAARAEFLMALRTIVQGLDAEYQTDFHSRALSAAVTALREADDFVPRGSQVVPELSVAVAVRGHVTPVLKNTQRDGHSPQEAFKCYMGFAQAQLAAAAATEVAGSMALHGLGKVYASLSNLNIRGTCAAESKAVVHYQAALLVNPKNYLSSNDLGVLLARCGDYGDARAALEHSLSISRQSSNWHNLAMVYRQLGLNERARRAEWLATAAQQSDPAGQAAHLGGGPVEWVDSQSFAESFSKSPDAAAPLPSRVAPAGAAPRTADGPWPNATAQGPGGMPERR
jgi:tetratricopeptide (TPR) repeat protein